jgi:dipeptidyl aminopeptidase/acylaminoacyl peptidase
VKKQIPGRLGLDLIGTGARDGKDTSRNTHTDAWHAKTSANFAPLPLRPGASRASWMTPAFMALALLMIFSNTLIGADFDPAHFQEVHGGSPSGATSPELSAGYKQAPQENPQRTPRAGQIERRIYKSRITPHWFGENSRFWYRNDLRERTREFILVDAESGIRKPAFDHAKLASALSEITGTEYRPDRLPFEEIEFSQDLKAVRFKVNGTAYSCDLESYACTGIEELNIGREQNGDQQTQPDSRENRPRFNRARAATEQSPDGQWTAFVKEHNVFIRSQENHEEIQLSEDGREGFAYGQFAWSPDSKTLVAYRIEPGDRKEVYVIESSPAEGGRARLESRAYALPGDQFTTYELNLFDIAARKQTKPEVDRFEHGWLRPRLRWHQDGRRFAWQQVDRGHQRLRVIEADSQTGSVRTIMDEQSETFIWTAHTENLRLEYVNWLEETGEIIYVSERDGWRQLYLVDAEEGKIKNQITQGEYVVRGIDLIDESTRQIWFHAGGKNPGQDPYFIHYYRVNFDGTGLTALTEGNGTHTIQYSPDRRYLIDTYSRVDRPPVHELRRVSDGQLICQLEETDISDLIADGWEPPEVFVAKGRDGQTDIWGIICRPPNFDPNGKYPVIEQIYAGPQGAFVPKSFSPARRFSSLTDLGFIVVQMDGMGTAHRSKAFHDVCWKNLKDAGFPDRILWHQAAAEKYPYYDLSRVGIYGHSAGGQNAAGALLFHPEFYKVAVASCGCHDNRMDKASWNEQWMGYPVGPQYSESSNIDNAHRLRGKLFLMVGEMDNNVPPESTLRFADALIKAGKDFDLLVIPGARHSIGSYGERRRQDYFLRHLLGVEPPDHNGQSESAISSF